MLRNLFIWLIRIFSFFVGAVLIMQSFSNFPTSIILTAIGLFIFYLAFLPKENFKNKTLKITKKKPFYKQWWFYSILFFLLATTYSSDNGTKNTAKANIKETTVTKNTQSKDKKTKQKNEGIQKQQEAERIAQEQEQQKQQQEAERIAQEQEQQRQQQEAERIAQEQEQQRQQQEAERIAQEQEQQRQQQEAERIAQEQVQQIEQTVYIAPYSGKKYHYIPNCRGLKNANSIQEMTLSQATNSKYTKCGYE